VETKSESNESSKQIQDVDNANESSDEDEVKEQLNSLKHASTINLK